MATEARKEDNPTVTWRGYEYEYEEKTREWFWALGIISAAVAIAALFFQNYLFAVLIIVASLSIGIHARNKPELKEFRVDGRGIKVGKKLYPYDNIESFWLDDKTEPPQLFFELKRPVLPLVIISVGTANSDKIREILFNNLPEKEHAVPLADSISKSLGF